jgi:hypothetical protein
VVVILLVTPAMKPPMKPSTMEVEARHEATDAAAWPWWRRRSKLWNLGFLGGDLRVWGWGSPAPEKRRLPKEREVAGTDGGGSRIAQRGVERKKKEGGRRCGCAAHPSIAALSGIQDLPSRLRPIPIDGRQASERTPEREPSTERLGPGERASRHVSAQVPPAFFLFAFFLFAFLLVCLGGLLN